MFHLLMNNSSFSDRQMCSAHPLHLWDSSMLKGVKEQTAVRLQQCVPSNPPVNKESNKGAWVDPPILLSDALEIAAWILILPYLYMPIVWLIIPLL